MSPEDGPTGEPLVQQSAYEDLVEIQTRLARASGEAAADKVTNRILAGIDLLGPNPFFGPLHHDEALGSMGYRKLVLGNYAVVYRVEHGRAVVLRVFYGSSDYARHVEP